MLGADCAVALRSAKNCCPLKWGKGPVLPGIQAPLLLSHGAAVAQPRSPALLPRLSWPCISHSHHHCQAARITDIPKKISKNFTMSAAALVSDAKNYNESGPGGIVLKKEEDQEKAGIPSALPFHAEILIPKTPPERPHLILPDAWLVTGYSERVEEDGSSSKICFGMVCIIAQTHSCTDLSPLGSS
jgi:hypothetical protein